MSAQVIADSLNPAGDRLTTLIVRMPRIVLAEFNTHRAFSRNSASSRAIPFKKMVEMVENDPFIPMAFQKDHKGMQGTEYFEGEEHDECVRDWLSARDKAVESAKSFKLYVTKQLRNRILEPFMWHTALVSSTEFGNFCALRAHKDAEIHIERLAQEMLSALNESRPKKLNEGEWHIPFGDGLRNEDFFSLLEKKGFERGKLIDLVEEIEMMKVKVAVARSARTSYLNFEGKNDYSADMDLCEKLTGGMPRHLSPTEHVAVALANSERVGNFTGFRQYRYFFKDQNLEDSRIIVKK